MGTLRFAHLDFVMGTGIHPLPILLSYCNQTALADTSHQARLIAIDKRVTQPTGLT